MPMGGQISAEVREDKVQLVTSEGGPPPLLVFVKPALLARQSKMNKTCGVTTNMPKHLDPTEPNYFKKIKIKNQL